MSECGENIDCFDVQKNLRKTPMVIYYFCQREERILWYNQKFDMYEFDASSVNAYKKEGKIGTKKK